MACLALLYYVKHSPTSCTINEFFDNPKPYDIVVAQYKEDVSWLLPYAKNVKLYCKSGEMNASAKELEKNGATISMLPNVGRESHTYLKYIIDNYSNLPEYVVFTQGSLEPHYSKSVFNDQIVNLGTNSISTNISTGFDKSKGKSFRLDSYDGKLEPANMNLGDFHKKYVKRDVPDNNYPMYWAAIFSVKKNKILGRPKSDYEEMIKPLTTSSNPEIGHFFERSWYYIFS
jgi:hypothetical protein